MGISARALRAGKAIIELSVSSGGVEKGLRDLQTKLRNVGAKFASIGSFGGGGSFAALQNLLVGSAATAAVAWPVKLAGGIQLAEAQLAVFTGSSDTAHKALMELQQFAPIAAQSFEGMATQLRLLMSRDLGAKDALNDLKALAVIAGGSDEQFQELTKAFADVKNATRLTGEEMRQFKNTGFNPLIEIGKRTGETMAQLKDRMEAGGISFEEVQHALLASVSAGGRFHGILEAISNTMLGQMRKAFAQFKLAVLPLGNEVLAPITKFFQAINGALPAFANFIKAHAGAAKIVLGVVAAIAAGAVAFTALGMSINLITIAAGGFASILGVITASLAAILSPMGLVAGALAGLATWFVTSTDYGRQMVNKLIGYFTQLATTAKQTFKGIADALKAGDIELASKLLWAGLKLAWLQATDDLMVVWYDFKDVFMRVTTDIVFGAENLWAKFATSVKSIWAGMVTESKSVGESIGHWLSRSSDPATAADQDRAHNQALERIKSEGKAELTRLQGEQKTELENIENARNTARETQGTINDKNIRAAIKAKKAAQEELDALNKKAKDEADNLPPGKEWFAPADFAMGLAASLEKAKSSSKPISTFDTRLSQQMFGKAGADVLDEQLRTQKKIEANTRRRVGLPVV